MRHEAAGCDYVTLNRAVELDVSGGVYDRAGKARKLELYVQQPPGGERLDRVKTAGKRRAVNVRVTRKRRACRQRVVGEPLGAYAHGADQRKALIPYRLEFLAKRLGVSHSWRLETAGLLP